MSSSERRRIRPSLVAVLLTALTTAAALVVGSPGTALADGATFPPRTAEIDVPGAVGTSRAGQEKALLEYWTQERIDEAVHNGDRQDPSVEHRVSALARELQGPVDGPVLEPVGKILFNYASGSPGSCTGTVVNTASGRLVITAGHCLEEGGPGGEWHKNIAFIPGYGGEEDLGVFTAANWATDSLWASDADERYDIGVIVLNDNAAGEQVADVAGAFDVRTTPSTTAPVHIAGYPATGGYDGNHQEHCEDVTEPTPPPRDLVMAECPNMYQGSSGGPWLYEFDPVEEVGDIYGVNGIFDGTFVATPKFTSRTLQHIAVMEIAASQI
ncbi:trypsin-like serine peptidase [Streptomyces blattellae]|uniref:trypsin-like serine peptidase n=1 Tax=Streptomyces blattellae TaxID=2569855 RepID=UPI0012B6F759|nr:trypsin-like peptidase domain-containing protein [Streptomyces blattellae]